MKLIFIRHGQATAYCADDAGRNLTDFGQAQALETAEHLAQSYDVELIITSPFNRAEQTARILQKTLSTNGRSPALMILNGITPDDDPKMGLNGIDNVITQHFQNDDKDKTIAIICHMPIVAKMVSVLDDLPVCTFDLAECRVLTTDVIAPSFATQVERFSPKQP
ncbi:MAG: histidine phosphatase family protein [Moraxella sp.]|nr:histidine phosphatase family protein [Moraxella sp.]